MRSGGIRPINGGAARPNVIPVSMGINCLGQLLPMHQVRAAGMSPITLSPIHRIAKAHAIRIVLIVEVIPALVINQTIHVIEDAAPAGIMT